jgi:hypothetical protein
VTVLPELLQALSGVCDAVDATRQTIAAIEDLREPIDVDKLAQLRDREDAAWREVENAWTATRPAA